MVEYLIASATPVLGDSLLLQLTCMCAVQRNNESLQQHFSMMTGVSPGASVKREKLQQRNAILRRTGFIEGPACLRGVGGNAFHFSILLYHLGVLIIV